MPEPIIEPGEVLIRVAASGICGTDVHIYLGEYEGEYPLIPGHEFSGVVEQVGAAVTTLRPGERVCVEPNLPCDACDACLSNRQNFCRHWQAVGVTRPGAMAQYVAVPAKAVFGIGELSFRDAAFVEPLSCVLHGLQRVGVTTGDRALVIGAGPIGLLLLRALAHSGAAEVWAIERNEQRLAFARDSGAAAVWTADPESAEFDLVVDATGNPQVMSECHRYARPGGRILLFGVPPRGATLNLDAFALFRKGLSLCSSFTSVRNTYQAIRLLQSGGLRVGDLVSHSLPLEGFVEAIETLRRADGAVMKVQILPHE